MADDLHTAVRVFLPTTGRADLDEWIAPQRAAAIDRIVQAVGRSPQNPIKLADDIFDACIALPSQLDPLEGRKIASRLKKVRRILSGIKKYAALINSDPHISATINKSRGVQPSGARQFLFELEALESVLVGQDKQVRHGKADLSATLNGRPPSELEWLAGLSLPLVYERHFSARAGRSRNARGEVGGPTVRFIQATLKELGIAYASELIARAFTRLSALRDEHRERKKADGNAVGRKLMD